MVLYLVEDQIVRFVILLVFMVLSFSFNRTHYFISVLLMTPFILILFSFLSTSDSLFLVWERIADTLIGSFIALVANYFIFPNWESRNQSEYPLALLKANLGYLLQIAARFSPSIFSIIDYKLARKEVYVQTANLAAAFQKMLQEPKSKQKNTSQIYQFLVLNNILSSSLSTLSLHLDESKTSTADPDVLKMIRKVYNVLGTAIDNMDAKIEIEALNLSRVDDTDIVAPMADTSIVDQLNLIYKTATDIEKFTRDFNTNQLLLKREA